MPTRPVLAFISDRRIQHSARELVARLGGQALTVAWEAVHDLAAARCVTGAREWQLTRIAVERMLDREPELEEPSVSEWTRPKFSRRLILPRQRKAAASGQGRIRWRKRPFNSYPREQPLFRRRVAT